MGTTRGMTADGPIRAVLFDRDGTLVVDVPYNGDPARVRPLPTASFALGRLRQAGIAVGVVSNQSGIARGLVTRSQVDAVNARVDELLGPFEVWEYCPHAPADHCACRKPQPGMVISACRSLGVDPGETVVIGDIGTDLAAARAAGAHGILVPTPATLVKEIADADMVAGDLADAVELVLATIPAGPVTRREVRT